MVGLTPSRRLLGLFGILAAFVSGWIFGKHEGLTVARGVSDQISVSVSGPDRQPAKNPRVHVLNYRSEPFARETSSNTSGEWVDPSVLDQIPLLQLKAAYYEREEKLQKDVVESRFPTPKSEEETKTQIQQAFNVLNPMLNQGEGYWYAKMEVEIDKKSVPIVAAFHLYDSTRPKEAPSPSPWVVPTDPSNLCWYFQLNFLIEGEDAIVTSNSSCLGGLNKSGNHYYVNARVYAKAIEPFYSNVAVSIPQPDLMTGELELLSAKTQKWDKRVTVSWVPSSSEEVEKLLHGSN